MTAAEWFKLLCSPLHWVGLISLTQSITELQPETSGALGPAQTETTLRAAIGPHVQERGEQLSYPPPDNPDQSPHVRTSHSLEGVCFLIHCEALGSWLPTLHACCFAPVISSGA